MRRHFSDDSLINTAGRFASQIAHTRQSPKNSSAVPLKMTVLDRMASTVKSDRAFLNNQRPFRLAAFFQRVTSHALPCIRKLVYLSRLRAIPSPHATGHCPPRAGRRRGERVRRRRLTVRRHR